MDKILEMKQQKELLEDFYTNIKASFNQFEQYISKLETENESLKNNLDIVSKTNPSKAINPTTDINLQMEVDLLNHKNEELNNLLTITKSRISELSNVLIDKEVQIKELKAINNRPKQTGVDNDSDQLFEAKMIINDQSRQIRKLQKQLDSHLDNDNSELIEQKEYEIDVLNRKINKLEQENIDLLFKNRELEASNINSQNNVDSSPNQELQLTATIGLSEIDSLLEEIATTGLEPNSSDNNQAYKNSLEQLSTEFEFTDKAQLAFKLLFGDGLNRDQFKHKLMRENEMIDSFIGDVNGYFEDQNYFELIVDNKNHYSLNNELFE